MKDDEMVTVHENIDNERGKKKITGQNHKKEGEKIIMRMSLKEEG